MGWKKKIQEKIARPMANPWQCHGNSKTCAMARPMTYTDHHVRVVPIIVNTENARNRDIKT